MTTFGLKVNLLFIAILNATLTYSQNTICHEILGTGIFEEGVESWNIQTIDNFVHWVDEQKFSSSDMMKKRANSLKIPIPKSIDSFTFSSSGKVRYKNKNYSSFSELLRVESEARKNFYSEFKTLNTDVLKEFNTCISELLGSSGLIVWKTSSKDSNLIQLHIGRGFCTACPQEVKLTGLDGNTDNFRIHSVFNNKIISGPNAPITLTIEIYDRRKDTSIEILTDHPDFTSSIYIAKMEPVQIPKPDIRDRFLHITTQISDGPNSYPGNSFNTYIDVNSEWVSIKGYEDRQVKVVVDEDGTYTVYTKSIHTPNADWVAGNRQKLGVAEASSAGCFIRVYPIQGDGLFDWKNSKDQ
jgi:hypothetical protein